MSLMMPTCASWCVCIQVQVDVEGCELPVLQGIQNHHWLQIRQVFVLHFYCLMLQQTARKKASTCCNPECMPGRSQSLSCLSCMHMCIAADKIILVTLPASLSACHNLSVQLLAKTAAYACRSFWRSMTPEVARNM